MCQYLYNVYHFQPEAEQDGDSWNDSSDEDEAKREKKVAASEGKLVAVLRSQVLGLTRENDQLREKLQVGGQYKKWNLPAEVIRSLWYIHTTDGYSWFLLYHLHQAMANIKKSRLVSFSLCINKPLGGQIIAWHNCCRYPQGRNQWKQVLYQRVRYHRPIVVLTNHPRYTNSYRQHMIYN